jgi:hypothetical protein
MTDTELLHRVRSMTYGQWYTVTPEVNELIKSAYNRNVFDNEGLHLTWSDGMDKIRVEYVSEFCKNRKKENLI